MIKLRSKRNPLKCFFRILVHPIWSFQDEKIEIDISPCITNWQVETIFHICLIFIGPPKMESVTNCDYTIQKGVQIVDHSMKMSVLWKVKNSYWYRRMMIDFLCIKLNNIDLAREKSITTIDVLRLKFPG